jgi:ketosteroid isomerase-like protein
MKFPDGYAIKMVTTNTEFSAAGDLGYALGTYEQTAPDKSGALVHTVGKWMSVFRKRQDGSWGAVADTFNVDPAP